MKKLVFILVAFLFVTCKSVKFKEQVLYDKYETPPAAIKTSQIIYTEGEGTMWNSLFDCGDFEISKEAAYSGQSSIKISWNKGTCEWIGFGNSYNNWQPVDLSKDRFTKALSFFVRTQTKTANAIPIVANLEDFSGGGSYYFIDASKYLKGLYMDTTWKQIIVPLWHFPIDEDETDIYSIKQVKFQLEGSGSFYLDDIQIIDYSKAEYQEMRAEVELLKPKGKMNQTVYREGNFKEDVWGYESNNCQDLEEKSEGNGNTYIYWKYNSENCSWAKWGMNWNGWYAMNFRGITEKAKIQFKVKTINNSAFSLFIEDFKGHKAEVFKSSSQNLNSNEWTTVTVPLKELDLKNKKFALDQIKQIYFEGKSKGEIWLDEIKITD